MTSTPHELALDIAREFMPGSPHSMAGIFNPDDPTGIKWAMQTTEQVCQAYLTALLDDPEVVGGVSDALFFPNFDGMDKDMQRKLNADRDAQSALSAIKRKAGI